MNSIFLDAGFAIAAGLKRDQRHNQVASMWPLLLQSGTLIVTTNFVLDEIVTFLNSKGLHSNAVRIGKILLESENVELIHVSEDILRQGWNYFVRHEDKRFSLTDCISFVVMQSRGLQQALTFDQHFAQAGFECLPMLA